MKCCKKELNCNLLYCAIAWLRDANLHPSKEDKVNKVILTADLVQHLVLLQVNDATSNQHLFKRINL